MKAWEITRKDLTLLRRDRRTLVSLLVLPMIFISIIGLTFGELLGWKNENQIFRIAVVDNMDYERYPSRRDAIETTARLAKAPMNREWAGNIVTELIDRLQAGQGVMVKPAPTQQAAKTMVANGDANTVLTIGPDFIERIMALRLEDLASSAEGEESRIQSLEDLDLDLWSEDEKSTTFTMFRGQVALAAQYTIQPYILCSLETESLRAAGRIAQVCSDVRARAEAPVKEREFLPKEPRTTGDELYLVVVPGYTVLFVFFLVNMMGHSFIHERELGTLRRLRAAPLQNRSLLLGKTVPFFIVSLVQTGILFVFGKALFNMSWGVQPWLLLPIIVSTSLSATCLGLLVATLVRTEAQVTAYANFIVILAGAISGCFMPREWLPVQMQRISLITPHAWALEAYGEALRAESPDPTVIFQYCGVLVGFALLYFILGAWRFRRLE